MSWDLARLARQAQSKKHTYHERLRLEMSQWYPTALPLTEETAHFMDMCLTYAGGQTVAPLARLFAASALLSNSVEVGRGVEHEAVWQILTPYIPELEAWRACRWVLCSVPCTGNDTDRLVHMLCGWSVAPLHQSTPALFASEDSKTAYERARGLAAEHGKTDAAHFLCFQIYEDATCGGTSVSGSSGGLPLFLAFCAAQAGRNVPVYATGALSRHGDIGEVGNIDRKAALCKKTPLIIPAANNCENRRTTFAAHTIHDALLLCDAENMAEVRAILHDIQEPQRFLANLTTYDVQSLTYMQQEICAASLAVAPHNAWYSEKALTSLSTVLSKWLPSTHADREKDRVVTRIVCLCYPWDVLCNVQDMNPEALWHISMRHMRHCNHAGDVKTARAIWERVNTLHRQFHGTHRYEEYIKALSLVVGMEHNLFNFEFDITEKVDRGIQNKIESYWNDVENDETPYKALVNYFGICGQHAAYRRDKAAALENFKKSRRARGEISIKDAVQTRCYEFFVHQDAAPCGTEATALFWELSECSDWHDVAQRLRDFEKTPYILHVMLRYMAQMPPSSFLDDAAFLEFYSALQHIMDAHEAKHPWQLVAYNVGRIFATHDEKALAEQAFKISMQIAETICYPTTRAMMLLPLCELWHMHKAPPHADILWARIQDDMVNELHNAHFASILSCATFARTMQSVKEHRAQIFPFNYR